MKNSLLYNALHAYVKVYSKLYFNKLEVRGLENIPKKGPVIFAANHQNAFLDAILVHITQPRKPHFLTRGDVFKNPIARLILRSLKMRPIYRFRDGLANVKRNKSTFSECFNLLETGKAIGIFPEGNHDLRFSLRPLQKGTARILYETEKHNNFELRVAVIPVGIQYYGNQHAQSDVLVQFGEPIWSDEFNEFKKDEKTYYQALTERIKARLSNLIIDIPSENYDRIKRKWLMQRQNLYPLITAFEKDKEALETNNEYQKQSIKKARWKKWLLAPIALYGFINHIIIYPLFSFFVGKVTSQDEFLGSLKFVLGAVFIPLLYILQTALLYPFMHDWAGIYLISLPLSGLVFRWFLRENVNKIWALSYSTD